MKIKFIIVVIMLFGWITLNAWEVNTHRAIDKKALEKATNLNNFMIDTGLDDEEGYQDAHYDGYGTTYFKYITSKNPVYNSAMAEQNLTFGDEPHTRQAKKSHPSNLPNIPTSS